MNRRGFLRGAISIMALAGVLKGSSLIGARGVGLTDPAYSDLDSAQDHDDLADSMGFTARRAYSDAMGKALADSMRLTKEGVAAGVLGKYTYARHGAGSTYSVNR